jgi:hypothetical protein
MPTRTSTSPPSTTAIPTLPPEEAKALVLDLLEDNAGCLLPCYWGFTPGKTPWKEARDFLATFAIKIYESGSSNQTQSMHVKFLTPGDVWDTKSMELEFMVINGTINSIAGTPGNMPNYQLSSFLNIYGQPKEVWIRTYANAHSHDGNLPFGMTLFYPHQGIMASYYPDAERTGDQVRTCPQKTTGPKLALWSPNRQMSFDEATTTFQLNSEAWPFMRLEEATGFNEATFYQTFKETNNTICLQTPAELWLPLP